jgi:hypothetical protein
VLATRAWSGALARARPSAALIELIASLSIADGVDRLPSIAILAAGPGRMWRGILSMAIATETQQLLVLERLRSAGTQAVTLDQLRGGGIDFPAVVIGELELNGYVIERVYEHGQQIGVRLLETQTPDLPASRRRHRWRRVSR